MSHDTYRVIRYYRNRPGETKTVRGLARVSLAHARKRCTDPESSSETCTSPVAKTRTRQHGPWFDGFTSN